MPIGSEQKRRYEPRRNRSYVRGGDSLIRMERSPQCYDEVVFAGFPSTLLRTMPGLADHTRVLVNGEPLEDLVLGDSAFSKGWLWTGPPQDLLRKTPQHLLGGKDCWTDRLYASDSTEPEDTVFEGGQVPLLADAGCGETFCSALGALVTCTDDSVVWSDFVVSKGGFQDDEVRVRPLTFRFSLGQYRSALGLEWQVR